MPCLGVQPEPAGAARLPPPRRRRALPDVSRTVAFLPHQPAAAAANRPSGCGVHTCGRWQQGGYGSSPDTEEAIADNLTDASGSALPRMREFDAWQ